MARLFDVVRELSGHNASISIPRPYIKFCEGNHTQAAVLNQLVFWSGFKTEGEWFYKANEELASEVCLSVDQVRYAVRKLKSRLGDVIQSKVKKANGVPTTHYRLNGDRLVELLFPNTEQVSQMDSVILPDGNGNITETNWENYQNQGSGNFTDSNNRSKPDTNKQISLAPSKLEPEKPVDPVLFKIPLNAKDTYFEVTQTYLFELRDLYPAVDVDQHIRNMIGWCTSNPQKRKTISGVRSFITKWLQREQDKGYGRPAQLQQHAQPNDREVLKRKVRELEMDINNENAALISFQQRKSPVSQEAVKSCQRKLNDMIAQREQLLVELGGMNGE
ncbi:ATPase [Vibrio sp. C8]